MAVKPLDIAVFRVDERGCVRKSFGRHPKLVTGINRVAQIYLLALLTDPGSIWGSEGHGGGLLRLVPRNVSDETALHADVAQAVLKAEEDVKREQVLHPYGPEDRLSSVTILGATFLPRTRTYELDLEIKSQAGAAIIVKLN